jgi:tRNA U34 5-methylaminomethyl-2-thiouridine-forming methyltransferase MnmC
MKELVETSDGSHTIYVTELDEHYHSVHGAVQESDFIFIRNGFEFCKADPLNIFEVGFGTGLNALLTAGKALNEKREVFYTSIEKYPLDEKTVFSLNHHLFSGETGRKIFDRIHLAEWDQTVNICRNFTLKKLKANLIECALSGNFDLIYFDAFGPDKQPEMWTREILEKISSVTNKGGILVTYSAKGEVKRNLRSAGFHVDLLPGPPGKRQMIRAIKN